MISNLTMEQHKEVSQFEVALTNILMADFQTKLEVFKTLKNIGEVINIPNSSPITRDLVNGLFGIPQPPKKDLTFQDRRLKILEIPYVPMKLIFAGLTIEDLFYFSTLSKKSKQLVENVKVPVNSISFTMAASYCEVHIRNDGLYDDDLVLQVKHSKPSFLFENLKQGRFLKVSGITLSNISFLPRTRRLKCFNEEVVLPMFLQLSHFFKTAFPSKSYYFEVRNSDISKSLPFFKTITNQFYEVTISKGAGCLDIDEEDLSTLLEAFTTQKLFLNIKLDGKYTKSLKSRTVEVVRGTLISGETLSNMKCEVLSATGTVLSSQELNGFLNHWKRGELDHLRTCTLNNNTDFDVDVILEGLGVVKWQVPMLFFEEQEFEEQDAEKTWCIWNNRGHMGLVEVNFRGLNFFKTGDGICEGLDE